MDGLQTKVYVKPDRVEMCKIKCLVFFMKHFFLNANALVLHGDEPRQVSMSVHGDRDVDTPRPAV